MVVKTEVASPREGHLKLASMKEEEKCLSNMDSCKLLGDKNTNVFCIALNLTLI